MAFHPMGFASVVAGAWLSLHHAGALMQAPSGTRSPTLGHRQQLDNFQDASYSGKMTVGGQEIQAIFDTGSFELVVLSKNCPHCGNHPARLFDSSKSPTYEATNHTSDCTYGSGTAYTEGAYDDVSVEDLQGSHQFFWKVNDADDSLSGLFQEDSFAAISGIGPSQSVVTFAEYELQSIRKELQEYKVNGGVMNPKIDKIVQTYEDKLKLAKTSKTMLDTLNILDMSVCFDRASGGPGYLFWNDIAARESPELFHEIPVVGDIYWSAELTDVKIDSLPQSNASTTVLGCDKKRCSAVIDTGTTLITAPSHVAYAIDHLLYEWETHGGSCDDLSLLPNLELSLGGVAITLPPEAYVARYTGTDSSLERVKRLLPHLYKRHLIRKQNGTEAESYSYCASTISPMDADSQFGPLWIMGMTFFREYYTSFHLSPEGDNLKGSSISISRATADCRPGQNPVSSSKQLMTTTKVGRRKAQLKLDVSKVRSSSLADRVRRVATPRIPGLTDLRSQFPQTKTLIVRI